MQEIFQDLYHISSLAFNLTARRYSLVIRYNQVHRLLVKKANIRLSINLFRAANIDLLGARVISNQSGKRD